MSFSKPRITYFNLAGRAEPARVLLEEAGVDYEFVGVTDWANQKVALAAELTFGQLPLYQDNDITLVQSQAIVRYLANKHGFVGSNDVEAAKIDSVNEGVVDLGSKMVKALFGSDESKAEGLKALVADLPKSLPAFETILEKSGGSGFLVGSKLSFADIELFLIVGKVSGISDETKAEVAKFPQILAFLQRIGAREKVKAYFERKPYGV
eukprot:TRINITY_DN282_c0_g1_i1.p1 TRINITY_DN282_c0_g1~~TRINITY_DN282_c0_g1_i1.p1  ORF type:complete len:209 (-),score=63.64 TRINITY_DN282_c0_g1_i1:90-716(-)